MFRLQRVFRKQTLVQPSVLNSENCRHTASVQRVHRCRTGRKQRHPGSTAGTPRASADGFGMFTTPASTVEHHQHRWTLQAPQVHRVLTARAPPVHHHAFSFFIVLYSELALTAGKRTLTADKHSHTAGAPCAHRSYTVCSPPSCYEKLTRNMENRDSTATAPWKSERKQQKSLWKQKTLRQTEN